MKFRRQDGGKEIFLGGTALSTDGSIHTEVENQLTLA